MATFYIQLEDKLLKISGDLTHDNIVRALGYTPSDFSGNFDDLTDSPLTQDGNGEFKIIDESGNIIAIVDLEGIHSIDFLTGEHKLSEKANKSDLPTKLTDLENDLILEDYATKDELDNIDFNNIKNNPLLNDENGELNIVDENNNIGLRLNSDGLYVKDVIAGDNILSNKVDKENGKGLSTEDFTTALKNKLQSLYNYDDTSITEAVNSLRADFDTLVSGDTSTAIKTFNEIIAFLEGVEDTESLSGIIASIEQQIANIDFYSIKDNPIVNDGDGKLIFADENGNIGLQLEADNTLYVKDVIAGDNILSNKVDKSELEGLATESYVVTKIAESKLEGSDITIPVQDVKVNGQTVVKDMIADIDLTPYAKSEDVPSIEGLATEQWVNNKNYATEYDLKTIDYSSINNVPLSEDETGELNIADENGNIGMKVASEAVYAKDFIAGEHKLSEKVDKTYVDNSIAELVDGAPETLDTLNELSAALHDNADIVDVLNQSIGNKQDAITDLETIRQGATKGATALQPEDVPNEVELVDISGDMLVDEPTYTTAEAQAIIDAYNANKLIAIKCGTSLIFGKGWFIPNINIRAQSGVSQIFLSGILGNYYIEHRITYDPSAGTISTTAQSLIDLLVSGGSSDANVQAVDLGETVDGVELGYATTEYVDGLVGDINSVLESIING